MIDTYDLERVAKASQAAELLVQGLRDLVKATNPLLAEMAMEILAQAVQTKQRLNRIELIVRGKQPE